MWLRMWVDLYALESLVLLIWATYPKVLDLIYGGHSAPVFHSGHTIAILHSHQQCKRVRLLYNLTNIWCVYSIVVLLFVSVVAILMRSRCGLHSQETGSHFVMHCGPFASCLWSIAYPSPYPFLNKSCLLLLCCRSLKIYCDIDFLSDTWLANTLIHSVCYFATFWMLNEQHQLWNHSKAIYSTLLNEPQHKLCITGNQWWVTLCAWSSALTWLWCLDFWVPCDWLLSKVASPLPFVWVRLRSHCQVKQWIKNKYGRTSAKIIQNGQDLLKCCLRAPN